jgi:hypothetical protein
VTRCHDAIWTAAAGAGCAVGLLVAVRTDGVLGVASIFVTSAILEALLGPQACAVRVPVRPCSGLPPNRQ